MVGTLREAQQVLGDLQTALDSRVMAVSPLNDLTDQQPHVADRLADCFIQLYGSFFAGGTYILRVNT